MLEALILESIGYQSIFLFCFYDKKAGTHDARNLQVIDPISNIIGKVEDMRLLFEALPFKRNRSQIRIFEGFRSETVASE